MHGGGVWGVWRWYEVWSCRDGRLCLTLRFSLHSFSRSEPIRPPRAARTLGRPLSPQPSSTGDHQWKLFHLGKRQCPTYDPKCGAPASPRAEEAAIPRFVRHASVRCLPGPPIAAVGGGGGGGKPGREAEDREIAAHSSPIRVTPSSRNLRRTYTHPEGTLRLCSPANKVPYLPVSTSIAAV